MTTPAGEDRPQKYEVKVSEVRVSRFGFVVRLDDSLPTGVVRLLNADGSGAEWNDTTGEIRVIAAPPRPETKIGEPDANA